MIIEVIGKKTTANKKFTENTEFKIVPISNTLIAYNVNFEEIKKYIQKNEEKIINKIFIICFVLKLNFPD